MRADILGKTFSRLTVIEMLGRLGSSHQCSWRCRCICGTEVIVHSYSLTSGSTKSCGCYMREMTSKKNTTHGLSKRGNKPPEYDAWCNLKRRCYDPKNKHWPRYGGRGIMVHDKWKTDFAAFYKDVGSRPSSSHSLDRINNNGNYEPGNVKWSTAKEQASNRKARSENTNRMLAELHRSIV